MAVVSTFQSRYVRLKSVETLGVDLNLLHIHGLRVGMIVTPALSVAEFGVAGTIRRLHGRYSVVQGFRTIFRIQKFIQQ